MTKYRVLDRVSTVARENMEQKIQCNMKRATLKPEKRINIADQKEWESLYKEPLTDLLNDAFRARHLEYRSRLEKSATERNEGHSAFKSVGNLHAGSGTIGASDNSKASDDVLMSRSDALDVWLTCLRRVRLMRWLYSVLQERAVLAGLMNQKTLLDRFIVGVGVAAQTKDEVTGATRVLTFNPDYFRVTKEVQVPEYIVAILLKDPVKRTAEDIDVICQTMNSLPSFRKNSKHRQLTISRIVRYLKCEERRIVLRKGHMSYSLYYVFSGSVCLKSDDDMPETNDIVLQKGACFGEIGLIKHTRRNATLQTREETELLIIDKSDYYSNGLDAIQKIELQYRFEILRDWPPFNNLSDAAVRDLGSRSHTEEFGYNQLVMADSRKSEIVWFLVKGNCDIQKLIEEDKLLLVNKHSKISHGSSTRTSSLLSSAAASEEPSKSQSCTNNLCEVAPPVIVDPEKPRLVCIKVGELRPGQVFGVENLLRYNPEFRYPQGQFCLTSKGCTIIQCPAAKFMVLTKHLNIDWLEMHKAYIRFPDDDQMVQKLEEAQDWQRYKRHLVEGLIVTDINSYKIGNYLDHRGPLESRRGNKLLEYRKPLARVGQGISANSGWSHPLYASLRFVDIRKNRMDEPPLYGPARKNLISARKLW